MDEKPKDQTPSSHSSKQHRLQLDEELRRNTPNEVETAKKRFVKAQSSVPSELSGAFEVKEVSTAAVKLTESVDKVCEALVIVFGKISEVSDIAHGQTMVLRSLLRWIIVVGVLQAVVCAVMFFVASTSWRTSTAIDQTTASQAEAVRGLGLLMDRVDRLAKSAEETKKTVAEVKKTADETATVQLVADPHSPGGAMVRIVPPKEPPKDEGAPPAPPKAPTTVDSPVDIPIKVDEARSPARH
jgi:hypothetical protein